MCKIVSVLMSQSTKKKKFWKIIEEEEEEEAVVKKRSWLKSELARQCLLVCDHGY
jgi:hypothetical protein